jgi:maltose/moltooligosaccharide transporter
MGIINMMIVIPMIFQTLTFGAVSRYILQNDAGKAISFAGVLLLVAALATLRIPGGKVSTDTGPIPVGGH